MEDHTRSVRVLICDDDAVLRAQLRGLFEERGYTVCGEAATGVDAILHVDRDRPDIVLLDLGIPKGRGLSVLPVLSDIAPELCTIVMTEDASSESVRTAISLGAKGYVLKNALEPQRFLTALERAAQCFCQPGAPPPLLESALVPGDTVQVIADELQDLDKVYVSGGLHMNEMGSVYRYHPVTAALETGGLAATVREILRYPDFFLSILQRMHRFREIPSVLLEQDWDGRIQEIFLKTAPVKGQQETICFATRHHEPAGVDEFPLGLSADGSPCFLYSEYPSLREEEESNEALLSRDAVSSELTRFLRTFSGLSLETCLFLSAFNISEIQDEAEDSRVESDAILAHLNFVSEYARWQGVPKAVLLGLLGVVSVPGKAPRRLLVTTPLVSPESTSVERNYLRHWADLRRYTPHLQDYVNRWHHKVMPLARLKESGTISILIARGQGHRYGFKKTTKVPDIFDEQGYTPLSLEDLMQRFPSLQLVDLMRPLLVNALMARDPSVRVDNSLETPMDVQDHRRCAKGLLSQNGLDTLQAAKPHFYEEAVDALEDAGINPSNPDYVKELVREITSRQRALRGLPQKTRRPKNVTEDVRHKRRRDREIEMLAQRFRLKYG